MQCPKCRMNLESSFKFCPSCGIPVMLNGSRQENTSQQAAVSPEKIRSSQTPLMSHVQGGIFELGEKHTQVQLSSFEISYAPVTQKQYSFIMEKIRQN